MIRLHTNHGAIDIELDAAKAPISAKNFTDYVESGHYANTVFHRVISGFMVQGGGFEPGMNQKPTKANIKNTPNAHVLNLPATSACLNLVPYMTLILNTSS